MGDKTRDLLVTFSVVPGVSRSLLVAAGVDLAAGVFWLLRGVEGDTDLELRGEEGGEERGLRLVELNEELAERADLLESLS